VVAAGSAADALPARRICARRCGSCPCNPSRCSRNLGASDVFLAMIEREAGEFRSLPKRLSYLCAGRAASCWPHCRELGGENRGNARAPGSVAPEDIDGFPKALPCISRKTEAAARAGARGRAYASGIPIEPDRDKFEGLFNAAYEVRNPLKQSPFPPVGHSADRMFRMRNNEAGPDLNICLRATSPRAQEAVDCAGAGVVWTLGA